MKSAVFTTVIILLSFAAPAQNKPCAGAVHRQFDFWIGEWAVSDTTGVLQGYNTIDSTVNACMLSEHWRGAAGTKGRSINYFDSADSLWHQTWVGSDGLILHLKGALAKDGISMQMKSDPFIGKKGQTLQHQITWRPNPKNGTVIQVWHVLNGEEKVLQTLFYGIYKRI